MNAYTTRLNFTSMAKFAKEPMSQLIGFCCAVLLCMLVSGLAVDSYAENTHSLETKTTVTQKSSYSDRLVLTESTNALTSQTLWQHTRVIIDTQNTLAIDDVLVSTQFRKPVAPYPSINEVNATTWLKIPLQNRSMSAQPDAWVFHIANATLREVDMYLVTQNQVIQHKTAGMLRPYDASQPYISMPLDLHEQAPAELYVRVSSPDTVLLPMSLSKASQLAIEKQKGSLIQGVYLGLMGFLLLYCFMQAYTHKNTLYLKYAILVLGFTLMSLYLYGTGRQFFWGGNLWIEHHIAGIASYMIILGAFLFLEHTLQPRQPIRWYKYIMYAGAFFIVTQLAAYCLGLFSDSERANAGLIGVLVYYAPWLIALPLSLYQIFRRNLVGLFVLLAIIIHLLIAVSAMMLVSGQLPHDTLYIYAFQIGVFLDSLLFMATLSYHLKHRQKQQKRIEHELKRVADTDPLTALANRRGLMHALHIMQKSANVDNLLVAYFIDLDDFKIINDNYGHDTGDAVLHSIAKRLQDHAVENGIVGRMGGDEFIWLAGNVADASQAQILGEKLLQLFQTPVRVNDTAFNINMSIGYAIYPLDTQDTAKLFNFADKAMYRIKRMGKNSVARLNNDDMNLTQNLSAVSVDE